MRLIILFLIFVLLVGCASVSVKEDITVPVDSSDSSPGLSQKTDSLDTPVQDSQEATLKQLAAVEIKDYKGERLDSIVDVRDVSIKGPQDVDKDSYRLIVTGMVENRLELTYDQVLEYQRYSKVIQLECVMGWSAKVLWEGILLKDLIADAVPKKGVNTVIFYAADGYTTSLPLNYIQEQNIILADKINNVTLNSARGWPFEVVAEDKAGYKWIKWVTKIELSNNPEYEGYWEQRGYPIDGIVN